MTTSFKLLVIATPGNSTNYLVNRLQEEGHSPIVILEEKIPARLLIKSRIKRLGIFTTISQLLFQSIVQPFLQLTHKNRIKAIEKESHLLINPIIHFTQVKSVNSLECIALVNDHRPNLILLNGTRILSKKTISSFNTKIINLHAGITPYYRGVHGAYRALTNNRKDLCGVTLHEVNEGVDTGAIIGQSLIEPLAVDCFVTYPVLQYAAGLPLLTDYLKGKELSQVKTTTPPPSRQWYHPGIFEYFFNRFTKGIK